MIKDNYVTEIGQTMSYQFNQLNLDISYHIAFSSMSMPYQNPKKN